MKGKIIVIDNSLEETKNMIIKENYIIAHTSNINIEMFKQTDLNNPLDYSLQSQLYQVHSKSEKITPKDLPTLFSRFMTEES